ncbi:MAG: hypothetical protein ABIP17_07440 [Ilumatobacteraceae bacterium]
MTPADVRGRLVDLIGSGRLDLADPGAGRTGERWMALFALARTEDVSVARLAEAHVDAVAILHEAGLEPYPDAIYGVWASVGPHDAAFTANRSISGSKRFCSGLGIVDRALIDVIDGDRRTLMDVDVDTGGGATIAFTSGWGTAALAATSTGDVTFDDHRGDADRAVGPPGWYLDRIGFWHGAVGPAACWAGGAAGLVDLAVPGDDPHRLARHGALLAERALLEAVLVRSGERMDGDAGGSTAADALATRYLVHESCSRILDQFARAFGPRQLIEPCCAQRYADTQMYIRQFHADHDLVALARSDARR